MAGQYGDPPSEYLAEVSDAPMDEVRAAEIVSALCLATDMGMGFPLGHGLHSTLVAMRVADLLDVDRDTAAQTYYGCLLFYVGCTADAEITAELFPDGALLTHFTPAMFGSQREILAGIVKALADPASPAPLRAVRAIGRLPKAARGHRVHIDALCQVARMLSERLGMPSPVRDLFESMTERWDGKGMPSGTSGDALPLALRIIHVARDATFQSLLWDDDVAAEIIRRRGGGAFDPAIAARVADDFSALTTGTESAWTESLAREPQPRLVLKGDAIDDALAAMADFTDLIAPNLAGHSSGVAALAAAAGRILGMSDEEVAAVRRAGLVHDIGRVAVPARIWQQSERLGPADWEQVRLHPYHSERVMSHSPFLTQLSRLAAYHHERLDGSGYHRGAEAPGIGRAARLLAAADTFHAKTEPRPHREAMSHEAAAGWLVGEAEAGRQDPDCVAAVITAAGLDAPKTSRPAGLSDREAQVIGLLARGLQTKQVARTLGISVKTADRHIQNAYAKIGVSTRAAAAVFAMHHGLVAWGELPIPGEPPRS